MADDFKSLKAALSEVLAPLLEVDGGELYVVSLGKKEVTLHLAGSWSGSPATSLAVQRVVEPVVRTTHPKAKLTVSSGWQIPEGAERVQSVSE
jgi:Fe-S cluster biogenesis protein NfuA